MYHFWLSLMLTIATIGTYMVVMKPLRHYIELCRGKTTAQIKQEMKLALNKRNRGELFLLVWGVVGYIMFSLLNLLLFLPLYVVTAISYEIGSLLIAYGILAVIGAQWLLAAIILMGLRLDTTKSEDEVVTLPSPRFLTAWQTFSALPFLYLWYLFLVLIGIL